MKNGKLRNLPTCLKQERSHNTVIKKKAHCGAISKIFISNILFFCKFHKLYNIKHFFFNTKLLIINKNLY